jgi:hypothetical protein
VRTVLIKPVLVVQNETRIAETLPCGALVELSKSSPTGWIELSWNGTWFSVFREDLLDACSADDVWRISSVSHRVDFAIAGTER